MAGAKFMDQGVAPGVDFFEDSSGDDDSDLYEGESGDDEWEDDNGTRDFSEIEGLGIHARPKDDEDEIERGRGREADEVLRALPPFNQITAHDSGTGLSDRESDIGNRDYEDIVGEEREGRSDRKDIGPKKARQMSLRRLGKVKIVHNHGSGSAGHGTPRESLLSNDSRNPSLAALRSGEGAAEKSRAVRRHRRNTSESLHTALQIHAITMRALESLTPSTSLSQSHTRERPLSISKPQPRIRSHANPLSEFPDLKSPSFTAARHINIAQISTTDPDRPAHLPAHFIKTPYPFTSKKEFPKPRVRPRNADPDLKGKQVVGLEPSASDQWSVKGKQVLGLVASDGEFDLRSKYARAKIVEGQNGGVARAQSDRVKGTRGWSSVTRKGSRGARESVVFLSFKRHVHKDVVGRVEKIIIPASLTTSRPDGEGKKRKRDGEEAGDVPVDFDDKFFAERLRESHRKLAGSWIRRIFSAHELKYIRLADIGIRSGYPLSSSPFSPATTTTMTRWLATGAGFEMNYDVQTLFTENNLMALFRNPNSGKARYTWVHWARRVAASNETLESMRSRKRVGKSLDGITPESSPHTPDSFTTIQFVHSISVSRILVAVPLILSLSIVAALLWIFLGMSGWRGLQIDGKGERVGPGMLVGVLVLAVEGVVFAVWVWCS